MINKATPDNKLDEAVKNALNNYTPADAQPDWSRMENMLNDVPKATSFKWSSSLTIILSVAVLAGGYFIYKGTRTSPPSTTVTSPENKPTEKITTAPPITKEIPRPIVTQPPATFVGKENTMKTTTVEP